MLRPLKLNWIIGLLVFVFVVLPAVAARYVDLLWFDSLGYGSVFWTTLWIKAGLFSGFFAATALAVHLTFRLLARVYSAYSLGGTVLGFDRQPLRIDPARFIRPLATGVSLVWGFLIGVAMAARWEYFALYLNGPRGGDPDPIFHRPLGFYLFRWPIYDMVAGWLFGLAVIELLVALLYAFIAFISSLPPPRMQQARRTAFVTCAWGLAAVLLVLAWQCSLSRFSQLWHDNDVFGVGYTEAHIVLPGLMVTAWALVAAALGVVWNALAWRSPRLWAATLAVPVVCYVGMGLAANYVSSFIVKPNELGRQSPYIAYNIEGTRRAFGLDRVSTRDFPTATGAAAFDLAHNSASLQNIRLWDWKALQATLRQVQVLRTYYDFPDVDVDRYRINGRLRQVMIAARELDVERLPVDSRNWVNDKLVYTHGYGVTMNTADGFTAEGRPLFLLSDVPVKSTVPGLQLTRPEIYFGQKTDSHVYVRTKQKEFDFPQGETNAYNNYAGQGGVEMGGFARRWLLAWALGDLSKIPFSNDITPDSRVLMYRNIRERVHLLAPFLTYDNDPYIVVGDDGHLYWMMDALTSSVYYPYSRHYQADGRWVNYFRNSVKVVIDAYDGTTNFYVFEPQDPVIQAYRGAFPKLFRDIKQMPAGLRTHVRYPELLFRTQADVYGLYHMRDVRIFFGREDIWSVAGASDVAPTAAGFAGPELEPPSVEEEPAPRINPYFVLMPLPGEHAGEEFVQIVPFTPSRRRNMIGWMAGRSDGANYGSLLTYNFPKSQLVDGPAQIMARINQDPFLSGQFTLWNQQGSTLLRGNMLVIPLGRSLLYVEPIFLQANQSPTPELRLVVLATQDRIAYGTNFQEALTKLLGGASAVTQPSVPKQAANAAAPNRQQMINQAAADLQAYQQLTSQGRYSEAGKRLESLKAELDQLRLPAP